MNAEARRTLALASGSIILIASLVMLVMSALNWFSVNERISVAEANSGLPPAADPARYLVTGSSRAESSADLQARLENAAAEAGIELASVRIAPEDAANPLHMTVDLQTTGTMVELATFLHAVESRLPALIVSRTRILPNGDDGSLRLIARIEAQRTPGAER